MGVWSKLENYAKVPHCTCGKCECRVGDKVSKMVDKEKAHPFLIGLNYESSYPCVAKSLYKILCHPVMLFSI